MIEIKDQEMKKILERAEKYSKELEENKFQELKSFTDDSDLINMMDTFFQTTDQAKLNDKNHIFCHYTLSQDEALHGCEKQIKYNYIDETNQKNVNKIKVKFPKDIKNGQCIMIKQCGNYIKETNQFSDLMIHVNVK